MIILSNTLNQISKTLGLVKNNSLGKNNNIFHRANSHNTSNLNNISNLRVEEEKINYKNNSIANIKFHNQININLLPDKDNTNKLYELKDSPIFKRNFSTKEVFSEDFQLNLKNLVHQYSELRGEMQNNVLNVASSNTVDSSPKSNNITMQNLNNLPEQQFSNNISDFEKSKFNDRHNNDRYKGVVFEDHSGFSNKKLKSNKNLNKKNFASKLLNQILKFFKKKNKNN